MKPQQVEEETLGASISPLLPQSSTRHNRKMSTPSRLSSRSGRENTPPPDPNVQIDRKISPSVLKKPPARMETPMRVMNRSDAPELRSLTKLSDSVKVVVRVRPVNSHEKLTGQIVQKISSDSVSVGGRIFTFDSAISSESTQEEVFQLVGVPLVQNSLAGFNTSVLSYGQTGSGKTYTMWGPLCAMVEEQSISSSHGIVPRIFHMLFSEIQKKQGNVHEKQINFQCRCSFLEIYNEQINDLLDPTHRNLQIRDDAKNGFYVENLTEEYVTSVSDVTQMLVKGLSNRRVGATSMNSKSSRSHVVFNCYIESWCKETSEKSFSSSRTSRISLIDLAGSEKDKLNGEGRHYINEGRHVKKSLSKLGELVNILAECTHSGQPQKIPYRDSCLTHLLQDSLGGNAKVTFICAISPDGRCRGGTLSTLRFGQRAKHITNNAVVNEITEDDVNELSDQIRQLKEELICEKSYRDNSACATSGYFKGHKARNSLNLLRVSLNRSLILPQVDDDSEEEVDVDEEDVTEFYAQLSNLHSSVEENLKHLSGCDKMLNATLSEGCSDTNKTGGQESIISQSCNHEHDGSLSSVEIESEDVLVDKSERKMSTNGTSGSMENPLVCQDSPRTVPEDERHASFSTRLSIVPCRQSLVLEEPTLSVSPKINNITNKNMKLSSSHSAGENNASESPKRNSGIVSIERRDQVCSSLQSSKLSPTDSLAASLRRGMQIIEDHQRYSAAKKSLIGLSFEHLIPKPSQTSDKTEAGVQTVPDDRTSLSSSASPFLCASCKQLDIGCKPLQDNSNMQIVPLGEVETPEDHRNKGKSLEEAMKRVGQLEKVCAEQAAMIEKLHLVVQNSHGLEDNAVTQKNELIDDEHPSLSNDVRNNSEILRSESKLKGFKKEHGHGYKSDEAVFDISQREESLLQEIESLRNQLQSYVDVSSFQKQTSSQLMQTTNLRKNGDMDSTSLENKGQELEKERERWTESESRWISLTEELRLDLESNRRRAEKKEIELSQERKCSAELDDALHRAILGHARFVEHFAELQEKYNGLLEKHRKVMEGVAVVKKAAAKAGAKGAGSAFAEALAAELSVMRVEREKERAYLKEQNKGLRIQLRDTAEAVHAAGELLVRLREAEGAVSSVEEKYERAREETGKMRKQMEKLKKKHAMEMVTMKHYLAESRLPESALQPLFQNDSERVQGTGAHIPDETEEWRSAFGPTYQ